MGRYELKVCYSYSINTLQPIYFPGFAFSWIALISHRLLMPKLLRDSDGQVSFHRLLLSLLRFIGPFLRDQQMTDTVRALYTATCKIFLVLLHDFPEFLSKYHISLCDALPASCLQLQVRLMCLFSTKADNVLAEHHSGCLPS